MAIALQGAAGYLFNAWGVLIANLNSLNNFVGSTTTTRINNTAAQFPSPNTNLISSLYSNLTSYQSTVNTMDTYYQSLAQSLLIQLAYADSAINPQNLQTALKLLISQMTSSNNTIVAPTISLTAAPVSGNTGNGVMTATAINPYDGHSFDYALSETITASCSQDSYPGGTATAGREPFSFLGQTGPTNALLYNWPLGSNCTFTLNAFNPTITSPTPIITDGDFESWVSNTPTYWNITTGTAGTQVLAGGSPYTGSLSLEFVGDGTTGTAVRQTLTANALSPLTSYGWNCWIKLSAASPAAGVLQVRLLDSSGNAITDAAGNSNVTTQSLTSGVGTTYQNFSGWFRTPKILNTTQQIVEISLQTPLSTGKNLYIDRFGLQAGQSCYTGGPNVAIWSGSTNFAKNDGFTLVVANSQGTSTFVRGLDRLLGLRLLGNGYRIPSLASGATIADSLVT